MPTSVHHSRSRIIGLTGPGRYTTMTAAHVAEFIRRFLLHVAAEGLPSHPPLRIVGRKSHQGRARSRRARKLIDLAAPAPPLRADDERMPGTRRHRSTTDKRRSIPCSVLRWPHGSSIEYVRRRPTPRQRPSVHADRKSGSIHHDGGHRRSHTSLPHGCEALAHAPQRCRSPSSRRIIPTTGHEARTLALQAQHIECRSRPRSGRKHHPGQRCAPHKVARYTAWRHATIPIAPAAPLPTNPRAFFPWRLSDAGPDLRPRPGQ